jgi:signal transduction histidine kinase
MNRDAVEKVIEERFEQESSQLLLGRTRLLVKVSLVLFPSYLILDYYMTPQLLAVFLPYRVAVVFEYLLVLAALRTRLGRRFLVPLSMSFILVSSFAVSVMTTYMGGFKSDYYVGNMIIMVVGGLFMPWRPSHALVFLGLFVGFYFGINLWNFGPSIDLAPPLFFLGGNAVFCFVAILTSSRTRHLDLVQRLEIERARDELKKMDESKTRFFSNVSHELRTPLTILLAPLESAIAGRDELSKPTLEAMVANARRLLRQVNLLLDFAKIEAGQMTLRRERANLGGLLAEMCKAASIHASKSGVGLVTEGLDAFPHTLFDADRMETLIANLISNALKFTPQGGTITVRGRREGAKLSFEVADTGIGIPADQVERVFERFHQVGDTQARTSAGTGLGLAMVREIAELHEGRVWVTSVMGQGSVFHVELPAILAEGELAASSVRSGRGDLHFASIERSKALGDRSEEAAADAANEAVLKAAKTGEPERPMLLIVEDTGDLRDLIARALRGEYTIVQAVNGRHGLELAQRLKPDLIISDVMMPEMSGLELCAAIRERAELKATPFVLLTAKSDIESRLAGLEDGADDYLTKPFVERELQARVRNLLSLQDHRRALEKKRSREFAQSKLASLGQMASGMAHEINSPLAALQLGITRLQMVLKENPLPLEMLTRLSQLISGSVNKIATVVAGVRMVSKEGSEDPMKLESLNAIVGEAVHVFQGKFQELGIELKFEATLPSPQAICRASEVSQALAHLLTNARDAVQNAGASQRNIRVGTEKSENGWVMIRVTDTGVGVPLDASERIFEPFFTTKPIGKGMGLGLSVARGVMQGQGGDVKLDRTFSGGTQTSFLLELPGAEAEMKAETNVEAAMEAGSS